MSLIASFFINIILYSLIIISINAYPEITEASKKKTKACIRLQQKKFEENEEKIKKFIKEKSHIFQKNSNKIILLAMAYCYDKISLENAEKINRLSHRNLNIEELGIEDLYNFENYNYDDDKRNKIIYENFLPIFDVVYHELTENEERNKNKYQLYFVHTNLFKFFWYYTIINTIIIFYIRIKNLSKFEDTTVNYVDKNERKKEEEKKTNNEKSTDTGNESNYRKLKKQNKYGKQIKSQ